MIGTRMDVCADNSSTERPDSLRAVARVSPTDTDDLPGHQGIWQWELSWGEFSWRRFSGGFSRRLLWAASQKRAAPCGWILHGVPNAARGLEAGPGLPSNPV